MTETPMTQQAYDPLDTVKWMLDEARRELLLDTYITDEGKARKKIGEKQEQIEDHDEHTDERSGW